MELQIPRRRPAAGLLAGGAGRRKRTAAFVAGGAPSSVTHCVLLPATMQLA